MRLDLFLKISRLIPRRSLAQEFCDAGRISVNGTPAKSSKEIKAGDEILINRRGRSTKLTVNQVPGTKQVSKALSSDLYQILEETIKDDDLI